MNKKISIAIILSLVVITLIGGLAYSADLFSKSIDVDSDTYDVLSARSIDSIDKSEVLCKENLCSVRLYKENVINTDIVVAQNRIIETCTDYQVCQQKQVQCEPIIEERCEDKEVCEQVIVPCDIKEEPIGEIKGDIGGIGGEIEPKECYKDECRIDKVCTDVEVQPEGECYYNDCRTEQNCTKSIITKSNQEILQELDTKIALRLNDVAGHLNSQPVEAKMNEGIIEEAGEITILEKK